MDEAPSQRRRWGKVKDLFDEGEENSIPTRGE